jgi:hypothetical protein
MALFFICVQQPSPTECIKDLESAVVLNVGSKMNMNILGNFLVSFTPIIEFKKKTYLVVFE